MAIWLAIGMIGATAFAAIALHRHENISSLWFLLACFGCQLIAYRFYSNWLATKALQINPSRPTPAHKLSDGQDFVPTNRWIVFGHHFAAIAGPGPLIGPTLAAQFGYLPSTIWIIVGSILAGSVQDMVILFASIRRNGKSLGRMIAEEIGGFAGSCALVGTLAIILILISVLGLVVVKALAHSPWGAFTVLMTIPIAMLVGIYLYYIRPHGVLEASIVGFALFLLAVYGGKIIHYNDYLASIFNRDGKFLAIAIIIYGFLAAVLPVWLLLTPRDYLSSFLKIGTIALLAIALLFFRPEIQMPAITKFVDGSGPIFSGKIFPFLFITLGCGAISGFHALVASGTTPKIIDNEKDIRLVGYGSMLLEGCVAIMALIAACILDPAVYFAINTPLAKLGSDPQATIAGWGFSLQHQQMLDLASQMGEGNLYGRTGGAPSLAVGMAKIFSSAFGENLLSLWYHFAIMFEAIFILTTLDAGTRVARFMLEDLLKFRDKKLGQSIWANIFSSLCVVIGWGYFLYMGVLDPSGGINILWPLFGMSNQMLAGIALCLATVVIYKKHKKYCFVTLLPLLFITGNTSYAVWQKVFSRDLRFINTNAEATIVIGQYVISALALMFLAILYIVIIATAKQLSNQLSLNFIKKYF
jgi:carbon starvation protein